MSNEETRLREDMVKQYRHVAAIGLNELSSGNISCRVDGGMLISPTGATEELIAPDTIVKVTLDGEWQGDRKPSSEWRMHAAIYKKHEAAKAVVHTHSDYCVAVSCHRKPLPGFHYLVGSFGGNDVPCVPYYTFGTPELGNAAAEALTDRTACLLGSHGMICRGRNLRAAVDLAHRLEIMARQYVLAQSMGEPTLLTDAEWDEFFSRAKQVSYGKYI
jgi:L-fuculose-phosphate aldolase